MDDFSQSSVLSDASTIPLEIIDNEDQDFLDEITRVHVLYFGNVDQHTDRENAATESSIGDSDDDDDEIDIRIREDPDLGVQLSDIDNKENDIQSNFQDKTCGCIRLYGKPCSTVVDWDILLDYRRNCMETSKAEFNIDIIIKIQLFHHRNNSTETSAKKHKTKEREKVRQQYVFNSQQVCRETFAFAHGINRKTVDSIALSLDKDGIIPRVHGNKGKSPKHALTLSDVKNVRKFLCTYANKYGLPLPGRLPNFRDEKALLLPSDKSKSEIHQDYVKSADELEYRKICLSEFKTIWIEQCPHILIMKPSTDLCHTCNSFTNSLMNSGNLTEEQKSTVLDDYKDHLDKVKVQRDQYRKLCDDSKKTFQNMPDEKKIRGQRPCSLEGTLHYSFDYAQQVHYPHYAQQVGPLFFKTPRKCQCFGVCSEGSGSQIFYLVDEAQHSNKGANTVTSMLHHHFTYLSYGETDVNLHMDNCSGQNKNNTVIGYGMWRVMNGLHRRIEFSLMEAGHTKFNPDWHFGLWKVKWRNTTAETINEIADSVSRSSKNGHNIPQLVDDEEKPVLFYDWATFLKKMFKPIPQLKTYHHFRMDRDHPGIVFVRNYANQDEISINILKNNVPRFELEMPQVIVPKGLDAARQWYLYTDVAPYCANTEACPLPTVPKPEIIHVQDSTDFDSKRKCGHCKMAGYADETDPFNKWAERTTEKTKRTLDRLRITRDKTSLQKETGTKLFDNCLWDYINPHRDTPIGILHFLYLGLAKHLLKICLSNLSDPQKDMLSIHLESIDQSSFSHRVNSSFFKYFESRQGKDFKHYLQVAVYNMEFAGLSSVYVSLLKKLALISKHVVQGAPINQLNVEFNDYLISLQQHIPEAGRKKKTHLCVHLADDMTRHGHVLEFSEDAFEKNHKNIRSSIQYQNGHARSRDTAIQMANSMLMSHVVVGGFFPNGDNWRCAADSVQEYGTSKVVSNFLGMPYTTKPTIRLKQLSNKKLNGLELMYAEVHLLQCVLNCGSNPSVLGSEEFLVQEYQKGTMQDGNTAQKGSFVLYMDENDHSHIGQVLRFLRVSWKGNCHFLVIMRKTNCETRNGHQMITPSSEVSSSSLSSLQYVLHTVHDCKGGNCRVKDGMQLKKVEQEEKNVQSRFLKHSQHDVYIVNMFRLTHLFDKF